MLPSLRRGEVDYVDRPCALLAWRRCAETRAPSLWLLAFGLPLPAWFVVKSLWIQVKMNDTGARAPRSAVLFAALTARD